MKILHFWKPGLVFQHVRISNRVREITIHRTDTCDTAFENWGSEVFENKNAFPPILILYPLFRWYQKKKHVDLERGGEKLVEGVKKFDSKSMDFQLLNAVSHLSVRCIVISLTWFEIRRCWKTSPGFQKWRIFKNP